MSMVSGRPASRTPADKARITLASALVNLPLAALKIMAGVLSHSVALVADGVYTASDVLGDTLTIAATRPAGSTSAPSERPSRETAGALLSALLILAAAGLLAWYGVRAFVSSEPAVTHSWLALGVASGALAFKYALLGYTQRVAGRTHAAFIGARAGYRHRDLLSSLIALVAIVGAMLDLPAMDALGALLIALMLGVAGLRYVWQSMAQPAPLSTTDADPMQVARQQVHNMSGVRAVRYQQHLAVPGQDMPTHVVVSVDVHTSLSEAQRMGQAISERLAGPMPNAYVQVTPDGSVGDTHVLPLREEIVPALKAAWFHLLPASAISLITLHYVGKAIDVDIYLPLGYARDDRSHQQDFRIAVAKLPSVGHVRLFYTAANVSDVHRD